jgi:hypothetical protein
MSDHTIRSAVELLSDAGIALYGANWQSPLARDLGVDGRMMRFWVAGTRPVPDAIPLKLPGILMRACWARHQEANALEGAAWGIRDTIEQAAGRLAP